MSTEPDPDDPRATFSRGDLSAVQCAELDLPYGDFAERYGAMGHWAQEKLQGNLRTNGNGLMVLTVRELIAAYGDDSGTPNYVERWACRWLARRAYYGD